jgi:HSP90 family molecular chaperone
VIDTGIGMTAAEVEKYINQIAFSGQKNSSTNTGCSEQYHRAFRAGLLFVLHGRGKGYDRQPCPLWKSVNRLSGNATAVRVSISKGKRKEIGTTITIHQNDENHEMRKAP